MALILKDRVKESSSSSGTGNITLGGAFPGYQTFNAAVASGSTVYYTIHNLAAGFDTEWEVGVGTFTSPATLARNTVLSSSTGSLINFTAGTEGLEVFITQPAEEAVYVNQTTGKVEALGNGTSTIEFTNINASNVVMVSGTISTNAANATDITNKQYVDGLFSQGVSYHEAVLVESPNTAGSLNAVYVQPNGAGNGVGATLTNNGANVALVIDGVSVSNTARVLIYNQSNAVQNGVYTVTNPGAPDSPGPGAKWVLTRATDADTFGLANPNTLGAGDAFFVTSGNTGAGETYVCTTSGTITFGSSNITFAQISSAQIYAAGTGLNLANLTFSIANTAVTAATYGNDGNVAQITVNAQGQLTNASNVAINASSITTGTLPNAQTTANSANGASTIVLRDTNGSFNANVGTFTTVNATTGNFTNITGNAVSLTDINASNITSGTISNARTTANSSNSASTLVLRDTNGAFEAGNVTAANFIGAGTTITSINASNISSGTIDNSRTTAASANGASTIVLRDAGGNFSANMITADITGNGAALTAINASNITSGTINNARTTASSANGASTIVLRDVNGSFDANVVNATNLSGGGTSITSMNASNLSAGTVASARISGSYTGITGVGTLTAGTWQGNVIATTYGGTNLSSFTANGVVYASSTSALATGSGFVFDGTNVGLGVTPSAWGASFKAFQIVGNGIAATNSQLQISQNSFTEGSGIWKYLATAAASRYEQQTGVHAWYNAPSGTAGNAITFTESMRIDSSGNVGIGTSSPGSKLNVVGTNGSIRMQDSAGTAKYIQMRSDSTNSHLEHIGGPGDALRINNQAVGTVEFYTSNTERMRIDSSGNVSIGTSTAFSKFGVSTTNGNLGITGGNTSGGNKIQSFGATTTSNGYLAFEGYSAEYMRITSAGNVGIGITSPATLLDVEGGNANTFIRVGNANSNDSNTYTVGFQGLTARYGVDASTGLGEITFNRTGNGTNDIVFSPSSSANTPTERVRITSGGRLGIGTSSPTAPLTIVNSAVGEVLRLTSVGTNVYSFAGDGTIGFYIGGVLAGIGGFSGTSSNHPYVFRTNDAERARFSAAGGFSVGTTSDPGAGAIYATGNITAFFSDERLKTVSGKIENALDKVNSLSGVYYTMNDVAKSHGYDSDETQVGVLAQEVEAVLPEIVKAAPFDLDENGNSKSGENYKTVQYEKLVPLLIEAIKELKAEVDALKGK